MPSDGEPGLLDLFLELVAIPSRPGDERVVADRVVDYLRSLGLATDEDDAAAVVDGNTGNILCRLDATSDVGVPLFFCAHLDTVPPTGPIEPVVADGVVRNAGDTILGADDKAAVVAMLEATRRILDEGRPHAGVELLFTPKEEVGLLGAFAFDHTRLLARTGFVYDQAAPIGHVVLGAPSSAAIDVTFRGRAAHAGMYPEEGRSSIAAAARAIADLRLGRIDEETSANVGTIKGGSARNIVPEVCSLLAEARSHDEDKLSDLIREITETMSFAATLEECEVEATVHRSYRAYRFRKDDRSVRLAASALRAVGYEPTFELTGGGADANVFNERGLECVNLANGMTDIHTPDEHIAVSDLDAMVDVTLALVDAARAEH